ncbi:GIY-YIG nuclease family protein [Campylobacter sp. JMF_06 NA1]|uniref:GIY-YIG nuclease family protein n=1 Tax=Campylobacter sp. JMF_06 NA1 TaxID=2983823 RepID=UPI0022E9D139|nr:GIY-YIG nuclease family protein [Campylobacter sp. JMF_06 NA1]MDA3078700.1 GIY-YIG nuclease family protein [Campylobacter sp. JMF_06 NA1]
MANQYFVYILFSKKHGTLYVGVTNDLKRRISEHKSKIIGGFTATYGVDKLGYFEEYDSIESAILREKQLKNGNRKQKIALIENKNPTWIDLYDEILF